MAWSCFRTQTASIWATIEELEQRRAVVFVHPTASAHQLGLSDTVVDFTADTTRAVAQMHYSNRFAQTPNVKYIFSHAGGTIPYLAGRFAIIDETNVIPGGEIRDATAATLRRLHGTPRYLSARLCSTC